MHLVMFDVDGTLVNSSFKEPRPYVRALKEALDIDCPANWDDISHATDTGIVADLMLQQKNTEISEKNLSTFRDLYIEYVMDDLDETPDACVAIDGAVELIQKLTADDNVMVALATGDWGTVACFKLAAAGFDINRLVIASGDDHFDRAEIMMLARERAEDRLNDEKGFKSKTYVGDSKWDKIATESLGWRFVGVGDDVKNAENHINDFTDTGDLFKF